MVSSTAACGVGRRRGERDRASIHENGGAHLSEAIAFATVASGLDRHGRGPCPAARAGGFPDGGTPAACGRGADGPRRAGASKQEAVMTK